MPVLEKEGFAVEAVPGRDERGDDILVVIAKRTYRLDPAKGACTLDGIDAQPPVHGDDVYEDAEDLLKADLVEDGEMAPFKPKADVIVRATAHAPGGKPLPSFEVSIQVGGLSKTLKVIGPRQAVWRAPRKETGKELVPRDPEFTEPKPIAKMPVSWKNAYGGWSPIVPWIPPAQRESKSEDPPPAGYAPCPFNMQGKGFAIGHSRTAIDGLELPCIEDPAKPLTPDQVGRDPSRILEWDVVPAGFGPVSKASCMRACFAGLDPVAARQEQARVDEQVVGMDPDDPAQRPVLQALLDYRPQELDGRFYNAAPLDQQVPELRGDEKVRLVNLDPSGKTVFELPGRAPVVTLDRGRGIEAVAPGLDTLVIDRPAERVTMVWRGRLRLPGGLAGIEAYPKFDLGVVEVAAGLQQDEVRRLTEASGWEVPPEGPAVAPPDPREDEEARRKAREIAKKKAALRRRLGMDAPKEGEGG